MIKNLKFEFYIFVLLFGLLAVFLVHNFDSIGQDIGRHLKMGEIIWQIKSVPMTNLFSFTEPDFLFINHHWLSEVIFYGIYSWFGFTGLILLKILFVISAFLLLFFVAKKYATFWPIVISFLFSIFIFISRTEVRPEIFSYLIFAFYLYVIYRIKRDRDLKFKIRNLKFSVLWFLPLAQLFWVNLHIYFFIGPLVFFAFLVDEAVKNKAWKLKFGIFILVILANLINPNFINGALYPLRVLNDYGYSIVENQTLAFLADFFGFNLPIFVFKISVVVLIVSFALIFKNLKNRTFEILISAFFIYAGFRMFRNLPLYALASFPVMAILLTPHHNEQMSSTKKTARWVAGQTADKVFKIAGVLFLVFMIFFVVSGNYYKKVGLPKIFGLSVPNSLERAVNFVKENKIEGPVFNNFDIGGYLIWKFPEEKVFVDNRPEAYSVKFFNEIYKPMQENKEKWEEFSDKYDINFIFFSHSDVTPWAQMFITNIARNQGWKIVYINEEVIILVKNNEINSEIISKFAISNENAIEKTAINTEDSNENDANLNITLSRFFYNINWQKVSVYFADEAIKADSGNPHPYLYKGLVYAYYTDEQSQKLAAENIKKAIDLGLKNSQYYYILGVVYMNLGRLDEARMLFEKALELDENNKEARKFLEKYFK